MTNQPENGKPLVSIIVPTRGRPDELARFVSSLETSLSDLSSAELILVVDSDDPTRKVLPATKIPTKIREVEPGLPMGQLNSEGYAASSGDWIFLLNDDVVVKTMAWDQRLRAVVRTFQDEISLVHVNDGIFQDKLCTFPIVSRTFCELAGGICPVEYKRYRIDDHIYHIFNLLAFLGHRRILYLEDILFEHLNRSLLHRGIESYRPDPVIHAADTMIFESYAPRRKEIALDLIQHMDRVRVGQRPEILKNQMLDLRDSVALRQPEFVTRLSGDTGLPVLSPRVTIGIVSADLKADHARLCIDAVKRYTTDYDLVILDNNRGPNFNHSREMNRILSICRTDLLVLMDDDVIVEEGWLNGMLRAMGPEVGVVTPLHKDATGAVSYAGVVMRPDESGHHSHDFDVPEVVTSIQTLCSAIMLIDVRKCGHIPVDESYSKYFLDIDYGLRVWEAGYRVVESPYSLVTHIGGATVKHGSDESNVLFDEQRARFVQRWMDTGRWQRLQGSATWRADPHLHSLATFPDELESLIQLAVGGAPVQVVEERLNRLHAMAKSKPVLFQWASEKVDGATRSPLATRPDSHNSSLAMLSGHFLQPSPIKAEHHGLKLFLCGVRSRAMGVKDKVRRAVRRLFQAVARRRSRRGAQLAHSHGGDSPNEPPPLDWLAKSPVHVVEEDYCGFSVVEYEYKFFAVPRALGQFDYLTFKTDGRLDRCFIGQSRGEAHTLVDLTLNSDRDRRRAFVALGENLSLMNEEITTSSSGSTLVRVVSRAAKVPDDSLVQRLPIDHDHEMGRHLLSRSGEEQLSTLTHRGFTDAIVDWQGSSTWTDNSAEVVASRLAPVTHVVFRSGVSRRYIGEAAHRLIYNKAYLCTLFSRTGLPKNKRVLEVGCSDGMVCDMLSTLGASDVVGVDIMQSAGCSFRQSGIRYLTGDAHHLSFEDEAFDLAVSIATFEHLQQPRKAFAEILRVLRRGGYAYIQAGPLYHSPFGHHMFGYFDSLPWIHLRMSPDEIAEYAVKHDIAARIEYDHAKAVDVYIRTMLSRDHVNGLTLHDYDLPGLKGRRDVRTVYSNISHEGEALLDDELRHKLRHYGDSVLTEHGFEVLLQKQH